MMGIKMIAAASLASAGVAFTATADTGAEACASQSLPIYFSEGSADLSASSQALIEFVSEDLRTCKIESVQLGVPADSDIAIQRAGSIEGVLFDLGLIQDRSTVFEMADRGTVTPLTDRKVVLSIVARSTSQS